MAISFESKAQHDGASRQEESKASLSKTLNLENPVSEDLYWHSIKMLWCCSSSPTMICDILNGERGRLNDRRSIRKIGRSIDQEQHHHHSLIFPNVTFDWHNPSPCSDKNEWEPMYCTITIKYPIQKKCLCRNKSKIFAGPTTNSIVDKPDLLWNCRLCAENCVQRRPESSLQGWVSDGGGGGEHDNYVVHDDKGEMMTLALFGTDGVTKASEFSEKFQTAFDPPPSSSKVKRSKICNMNF